MSNRIERIKQNVSITDILPNLKSSGTNNCIFCEGRGKASVYNNSFYRCYKCGVNGDVITLYRMINGCEDKASFITTLEELENIGNIESYNTSLDKRSSLLEKVLNIYHSLLWSSQGESARSYLNSRGFDDLTLQVYNIGYAPKNINLSSYEDITRRELQEEGLLDYFSNRVIFPIRDIQGKLVHLIGRSLDQGEDVLRYKDTKSGTISGSSKSYLAFEHLIHNWADDYVVITEGYPDALTLNQNGIPALGILGLEGICKQAYKLSKFKNIIVMADNDYYPDNHPKYPLEYKSWRRLIPQLYDLQLILDKSNIDLIMIPESGNRPDGSLFTCKDVNDLFTKSNLPIEEIMSMLKGRKKNLVSSLIEKWGCDLSKHMSLIRLVYVTGKDSKELEKYIPPEMSPLIYALSIFGS